MRRVFAELEDENDNCWGCWCPRCKGYHALEDPAPMGETIGCVDCGEEFLVSFVR